MVIAKEPKNVGALSSLAYSEIKRKNKKEVRRIIELLKPLSPGVALKVEQNARLEKVL